MFIAIVLALIGLGLIYLEFFLPGGIIGFCGGGLALASVVVFILQGPSLFAIGVYVILLLLAAYGTCKLALWHIKKTGHKKTFYLDKDQEGYTASHFNRDFIGKTAIALTDLKPSGHILIENEKWQAVSNSNYLAKGTTVVIIGGKGSHFLVKEKKENT